MARARIHLTAAARQKAYQDRLRSGTTPVAPVTQRRTSRPKRLEALVAAIHVLADEYRDWREALPDNLAESALAEQLDEVGDQLDQLADDLAALDLPRGFGR